jgi:hypothetical protein
MEKKELIVKCTDNCSCLSIDKYEDEPEYYITTYRSYATKGWRDRLINAWSVLLGDNIVDTEMILSEEDFNKIRQYGK